MGRYYSGDIEGKFWFGVQSSDDASFFGAEPTEPNYLEYYFTEDDLAEVKKGLKECKKELGKYKIELDQFFQRETGYTDEMMEEELKVNKNKAKELLTWYARLELGEKIAECIEESGQCSFEAEL